MIKASLMPSLGVLILQSAIWTSSLLAQSGFQLDGGSNFNVPFKTLSGTAQFLEQGYFVAEESRQPIR